MNMYVKLYLYLLKQIKYNIIYIYNYYYYYENVGVVTILPFYPSTCS